METLQNLVSTSSSSFAWTTSKFFSLKYGNYSRTSINQTYRNMKKIIFIAIGIVAFVVLVYFDVKYIKSPKENEDVMENITSYNFEQDEHSFIIYFRGENFSVVHDPDCKHCWQYE